MIFEKGHLYHIYNQGNNRQDIFFNRDNYLFFLKKINTYILPYADIIAWCLMPNHFHLMVRVNEVEVGREPTASLGATPSVAKSRSINESIGIMLRSYTSAINKQQSRTGKLFREKTKSECITQTNNISPSFYNVKYGTIICVDYPEKQYPQICFEYIHQNPVRARMVKRSIDWEFSSAQDYAKLRNGKLINKEVAKEYIDF